MSSIVVHHRMCVCEVILTCVCSHVSLQVKGVVEAFPAVPARVSFDETVTLQVTGEHALQRKHLMTHRTQKV